MLAGDAGSRFKAQYVPVEPDLIRYRYYERQQVGQRLSEHNAVQPDEVRQQVYQLSLIHI